MLQIPATLVGVNDLAAFGLRHRVNRQIPALEILLKAYALAGIKFEAGIARRYLGFGSGERIFLFRLWMQENRKALAHLRITQGQHQLPVGTDHHPISILDRNVQ